MKLDNKCLLRGGDFYEIGTIKPRFMATKQRGRCFARKPVESEAFRSTWVFQNYGNIDIYDPTRMFNILKGIEVQKVLFAGDSLSTQTYYFCL